jgi:hypothetical protein
MAYNKNDFIVTIEMEHYGIYGQYTNFIAHNKSSIPITWVYITFNERKNGVILRKVSTRITDIAGGEKRRLLSESTYSSSIEITDISVQAADGTNFHASATPTFPILKWIAILVGIALILYFVLPNNSMALQNAISLLLSGEWT